MKLTNWLSSWNRVRSDVWRRAARNQRNESVEYLEDRTLLATISVDVTTDPSLPDGNAEETSLREAIEEANTNGDVFDVIRLEAETYTLEVTGSGEDANATGDLDITQDTGQNQTIILVGKGAGQTIIDGASLDRVLDVHPGATLIVINVTVTGGATVASDAGGGIRNRGQLLVSDSRIEGNSSAAGGGGIANVGLIDPATVNLADALAAVAEAQSEESAAYTTPKDIITTVRGVFAPFRDGSVDPGDINESLNVLVDYGNLVQELCGHPENATINGVMTILRSVVTDNSAATSGGGVLNDHGLALIAGTSIGAEADGVGGITGTNSAADGGGLANDLAAAAVINTSISVNTATGTGGGVHNNGKESKLGLVNTTVSSNIAEFGGGIANGLLSLLGLANVTVTENVATSIDQTAANAGGILNAVQVSAGSAGIVVTANSIIAGNTADSADAPTFTAAGIRIGDDLSGAFASAGYNVIGDQSGQIVLDSGSQADNRLKQIVDDTVTVLTEEIDAETYPLLAFGLKNFEATGENVLLGFQNGVNNDQVGGTTGQIFAVTPTTPIVVRSPNHGLQDGSTLTISGVRGATSNDPIELANGTHVIGVPAQATDEFTVPENGIGGQYRGGGYWKTSVLDAGLGSLADNDGLTLTHSLNDGSPAIDAANPLVSLPVDQRNMKRRIDGDVDGSKVSDAGAVEVGTFEFTLPGGVNEVTVTFDEISGDMVITDDANAGELARAPSLQIRSIILSGSNGDDRFDLSDVPASVETFTDLSDGGDDTLIGGPGKDAIKATVTSPGDDIVADDATITIGGILGDEITISDVDGLELIGGNLANFFDLQDSSSDVTVDGGDGDDTFVGGSGNDRIDGGPGDDLIDLGSGNDIGISNGNDTLDGGDGVDRMIVLGTESDDTFALSQSSGSLITQVAGFTKTGTGFESHEFNGGRGDDAFTIGDLNGVTGLEAVTIRGEAGNDGLSIIITGDPNFGISYDGGIGNDIFDVTSVADGSADTWKIGSGGLSVPPITPISFLTDHLSEFSTVGLNGTDFAGVQDAAISLTGSADDDVLVAEMGTEINQTLLLGQAANVVEFDGQGGLNELRVLLEQFVPGSQPMGLVTHEFTGADSVFTRLESVLVPNVGPPEDTFVPNVGPGEESAAPAMQISASGISTIVDQVAASVRGFRFGAAGNSVILGDDSTVADGISLITSDESPDLRFVDPEELLLLATGEGNDEITVNPLDENFTGPTQIETGADDDTVIVVIGETADALETGPILFDGGEGGGDFDTLHIVDDPTDAQVTPYDEIAYDFTGDEDGEIRFRRSGERDRRLSFRNLEPVTHETASNSVGFSFGQAVTYNVQLSNAAEPGFNLISSNHSESVKFRNPEFSIELFVNEDENPMDFDDGMAPPRDFDDHVLLLSVDPDFTGSVDVTAGQGDDTLQSYLFNRSTLRGGTDDDTILPSINGMGTALGGDGNDMLIVDGRGALLGHYLNGGLGNDTLNGGMGKDTLIGGAGDDLLQGEFNDDSLDGGDGNDILAGGAGADTLSGGDGDDRVRGQGGSNDRVSGGPGIDTLEGGAGTDLLVETLGGVIVVTPTTLTDDGVAEEVSGFTSVELTGSVGHDTLDLSLFPGPATLFGSAGNDIIVATAFSDQIDGGSGNDIISGLGGNDVILGGSGNDTLRGAAGRDDLSGGDGNDLVQGQGATGDTVSGGPGRDTLDGGSGADRLVEEGGSSIVLTDLNLVRDGESDVIISVENATIAASGDSANIDTTGFSGGVRVFGTAGNDVIQTGDSSDFLFGLGGNDSLSGGGGADILFGGAGRDTLEGGAGDDWLRGQGGGNDSLVGGLGIDTLDGGAGLDRITQDADDVLVFDPLDVVTVLGPIFGV